MAMQQDLTILQGRTFLQTVNWETTPIVYKPITAITQGAPVSITATGHGVPNGWRVAIVSVGGMVQLNSPVDSAGQPKVYHQATVVDPNTIQLNDVNSAGFAQYTTGGYVQYNTPVNLTGYTARMSIKDMVAPPNLLICTQGGTSGSTLPTAAGVDGTVTWAAAPAGSSRTATWAANTAFALNAVIDTHELLRLDTVNARIVLDTVNSAINLVIDATTTAAIWWQNAVYDLELISAGGVVTAIMGGNVTCTQEVTIN